MERDLREKQEVGLHTIPGFFSQPLSLPLSHIMNIIIISSGGRTPPDYSANSWAAQTWPHVSLNQQQLEHYNLTGAANFMQWNKSGYKCEARLPAFHRGRVLPD